MAAWRVLDADFMDGRAAEPGSRRIPALVWSATEEARRRIAAAEAEAGAILEAARAEARTLRAAAVEAGREEGLGRTVELLARAETRRERLLGESEGQLVELAFQIARRVLGALAETDRRLVVEVAGRALELARRRSSLRLRVHPDDLAALQESEPALARRLRGSHTIAFLGDPEVGRGGVVVETEAGTIDARLATQLEALRRALDAEAG